MSSLTALLVREVERQQRLVAQQHLRIADQRLGDAQALLLSAGEESDRRVRVALGADRSDRVVDERAAAGGREREAAPVTVEPEPHEIATADRQVAIERTLLRHVPDIVAPAPGCPAVDLDFAARQPRQPEQDAQQRRLPRTVRAEHREEFAGRDVEVEMLEQGRAYRTASTRRATGRSTPSAPERRQQRFELMLLPRLVARLVPRLGLGDRDHRYAGGAREVLHVLRHRARRLRVVEQDADPVSEMRSSIVCASPGLGSFPSSIARANPGGVATVRPAASRRYCGTRSVYATGAPGYFCLISAIERSSGVE